MLSSNPERLDHLSYFIFLKQAKRRLELDITDHQYSEPAKTLRSRKGALKLKVPKGIKFIVIPRFC